MAQVALADVEGAIASVAQVPLGHDPKRTNGRQRSRIGSAQCVFAVAVVHELALRPFRQVEIAHKHVPRVASAALVVPITGIAPPCLCRVLVPVAHVIIGRTVGGCC
jgi:hypothetical protein